MRQDNTKAFRLRMIRTGRRKKQSGELSLIEAGAYMAGAALLAIAVIKGGSYVYNLIKSQQFTSEAQMFHTGILNATQNDADFSTETLTTLATNRAFDAAGSRLASDKSSLKGIFNQPVTISVGTLSTANDSLVMSYQVPSAICAMSVAALTNTYSQVGVNGTTLSGPTAAFSSDAAGTACAADGAYATLSLYTSRT